MTSQLSLRPEVMYKMHIVSEVLSIKKRKKKEREIEFVPSSAAR